MLIDNVIATVPIFCSRRHGKPGMKKRSIVQDPLRS